MSSLNEQKIKLKLKTEYIGKNLYFFDSTTSTFDEAEKLPKQHGTVICAKKQTNGRGRLGRSWESSSGGIYFSIILKPQIGLDQVQIMTSLCAVAVQRAISSYIPCKIKWPNDIVSDKGKKLCGILTKICTDENDEWYINVGIGINANVIKFDSKLKYASSIRLIKGCEIDENVLFCTCLEEIERTTNVQNIAEIIDEYKKASITLGKQVRVIYSDSKNEEIGLCTDIKNDGTLVIQRNDGTYINVNSGEVSVRGIYGEEYV